MDRQAVCQFLSDAQSHGTRCVLVTVCAVEGSSMRNPGTIMGVAEDGSYAGSLSGGCIENAVVSEALDLLNSGGTRLVRYGSGSPYLDIKLPCGGGLDLHFAALSASSFSEDCLKSIKARDPFAIAIDGEGVRHLNQWHASHFDTVSGAGIFGYWPIPHLQIIGHGAGVQVLATQAKTLGCLVQVLTPDQRIMQALEQKQFPVCLLKRIDQTNLLKSDPWTATVFLFHDHDWEIDLMERALEMPHFYLGAMGGRRAHAFRCDALKARGVTEEKLSTIHAPIGLFHSSRDPHTLALSTLAEVIRTYQKADFEAPLG